jgi:hypothetical protein
MRYGCVGGAKGVIAVLVVGAATVGTSLPAGAAKPVRLTDKTPPTISVQAPAAGANVSGTVAVAGTAGDNVGVASVRVTIDGSSPATASGTTSWSWSWNTSALANGSHTVTVTATDKAGLTATASRTVTVDNPTADTSPPSMAISAPAAGSSVSGTVAVTGTASDDVAVTAVEVALDGGTWVPATGTSAWSWSWNTTSVPNGSHTITARARDGAGNMTTATRGVSVSNVAADTTPPAVSITTPSSGSTVSGAVSVTGAADDASGVATVEVSVDGAPYATASGTTSWSWSWGTTSLTNGTHTISARATDTAGNQATASASVTVSNSTIAPNTQGTWVSPEGVTISVASAGPWTISRIYDMLKANAIQLDLIGPTYTIKVQDEYPSQTVTSARTSSGVWGSFRATTYLKGVNSTFANQPNAQFTYEYGGAWSRYHLYMTQGAQWDAYLDTRWSTADGPTTIGEDSRLGSTMSWDVGEMICDDYRLLFGSSQAISERQTYVNPDVVDPRDQPGLRDWFLNGWA